MRWKFIVKQGAALLPGRVLGSADTPKLYGVYRIQSLEVMSRLDALYHEFNPAFRWWYHDRRGTPESLFSV